MKKISFPTTLLAFSTLLSANAFAQNLLPNGDFNSFNTANNQTSWKYTPEYSDPWYVVDFINPGFSTDYVTTSPEGGSLYSEGALTVGINPSNYNNNFRWIAETDGNMLIVNGATGPSAQGAVIWQASDITITANSYYTFEGFATNINKRESWGTNLQGWKNSQAILSFEVLNGDNWVSLGNILDLTQEGIDPDQWHLFSDTWFSGNNTSTSIRLVNQQTAADGNDFALDSLSFVKTGTEQVPEPSSAILSILGGLLILRRRR